VSSYEELRKRHVADLRAAMPGYKARLDWSRAAIDDQRRRALQLLLRVAKQYSPWWRERLRELDPSIVTEADLARIPPMTRDDLMNHWDEIVIYPSLRLEQIERNLDQLKDDAYVFDAFHAVASSGACGRRGVFAYDWEGWIASFAGCARWRLRSRASSLGASRPTVALVASERASHINCAISQTFNFGRLRRFPAALPVEEIVRGLNAARPDVLIGYPSVLQPLAEATRRGDLEIRPAYVNSSGEPLLPELREEFASTWGARVNDFWSASEALPLAQSCAVGRAMHLNDDLVIAEPVDAFGRRVQPGFRSAKVYLTNLFNLALPLIRYELNDQITLSTESCVCGSAYTGVQEVRSRFDERFVYEEGVVVDPDTLDSVFRREKAVYEYQVRQTENGAEVRVRCDRNLHLRAVGHRVASALGKRGVEHPAVSVQRVERIERGPAGKLQRFVPRSA
jgi:phenylacetate-coenzyme A ligase PaaK-like adenylate-forming protein